MATGKVKKIIRGEFGFIQPDDGSEEVYFRLNWVRNASASRITVDMSVEYEPQRGHQGLQTKWVRALSGQPFPLEKQTQVTSAESAQKGGIFHNPYNFVRPISGKPIISRSNTKLLDRCLPPPHDRWLGLSGKIQGRIQVKTPLFVSATEGVSVDDKEHKSYQFFTVNGQKAISASSLRGVLRSTYEAVTNSCFANLADSRLSYRLAATDASKLVPGRVIEQDGQWYVELLTGTTRLKFNQQLTKNDMQYAAWIHQYWPVEPSKTLVKPMDEIRASQELKKNIRHLRNRTPKGGGIDLKDLKHGDKCFALLRDTHHPFPSIHFWDVVQIIRDKASLKIQQQGDRLVEGWLCLTNQNTERKHSERFFFTTDKQPLTLSLNEEVCQDYEMLMREYFERHEKDVKRWRDKKRNPNLAQPQDKEAKDEIAFSRFVARKEDKLKSNVLVYVKLKGEAQSPEVDFLVPVSVSRVLYTHSIGELLPYDLHRCQSYDALCPACRLFGWVHGEQGKEAYRGRIRISHALLVEGKEGASEESMRLQILSSPKPTTTYFYLVDQNGKPKNGRSQAEAGYNNLGNHLRGRKYYRHYVPTRGKITLTKEQQDKEKNWDQNRTICDPVGTGAEFEFEIAFENLTDVELGAFLWTLTLDNEAYHKIGYGKALGLGSVQICISDQGVVLDNMVHRYKNLPNASSSYALHNWQQLIELFKKEMQSVWQKPFDQLEPIKDLKALLAKEGPSLPVHYPYSPVTESKGNFEWFMGNTSEKGPKLALPLAIDTSGLPLLNKKGQEV
ncbi:MAG: TIGR03986 family CRISPR-associated RAMP protein [Anaerolineae bacterium]|nr:TIGR03986 family CRISPR-associated RAMP protein [Anaerolineae bacterium]